MNRSSLRSRASVHSRWSSSGASARSPARSSGAVFVKSTEWFSVITPVRFRFLFTFAGSGIGLLLVLWLLPGGFGSVLYGIRDAWLRFVARRRGIVAPALVTDAGISRPPLVRIPVRLRLRRPLPGASTPSVPASSGLLAANDAPLRSRFATSTSRTDSCRCCSAPVSRFGEGETDRVARHERCRASPRCCAPRRASCRRTTGACRSRASTSAASPPTRSPPSGSCTYPAAGASSRRSASPTTSGWERGCVAATAPPWQPATARVPRPLPVASRSARRARRRPVGRSTADAHHRDVAARRAEGADDRRAVARPEPTARSSSCSTSSGNFTTQGVTVIVVEQSVNTALNTADRAYFLEKGTIRFHGLTADLLERPDLLRSIFLEGAASEEPVVPAVPAPSERRRRAASCWRSTASRKTLRRRHGARRRDDRAARRARSSG